MKQKNFAGNRESQQLSDRILVELLRTAADLDRYGLMSKEDMVKLGVVCDAPPACITDSWLTGRRD